ncbi:DUF3299 domain-containing protein [Carboxylicivirga sp. RSCT41]|uniref:DUF3299 domain-containing protein n=1 Tax=Carboxylicivirga agarovorans TaxID=3417570 RepID=UPI003D328243
MNDPNLQLNKEQRGLIWDIAMIQSMNSKLGENKQRTDELDEKKSQLADLGLNADTVIKHLREFVVKQEKRSQEPVIQLNQQLVRIGGYLLPLNIADEVCSEFLLVPWVGACIHTPPPQKNQIIYLRYEKGFKVKSHFEAVWVEGQLLVGETTKELFLVDGTDDILSGYKMRPLSIEALQ